MSGGCHFWEISDPSGWSQWISFTTHSARFLAFRSPHHPTSPNDMPLRAARDPSYARQGDTHNFCRSHYEFWTLAEGSSRGHIYRLPRDPFQDRIYRLPYRGTDLCSLAVGRFASVSAQRGDHTPSPSTPLYQDLARISA